MDIGKRLAELREKYGFSRNALAKQSGVALSFVNDIEKGSKSPTVHTIKKLCDTMGISLAEFFSIGTNDPTPEAQYLSTLISAIKTKGYSEKIIAEWLISLSNTLTELSDKYAHVVWAKENPTEEEIKQTQKLEEKLKDPNFIPPWERK
jgi:transcriptional regulator with XRE-family HTH domain